MWFPQVNTFSPTAGNCVDVFPKEIAESVSLIYGLVDTVLVWKELIEYSIFSGDDWFRFWFLTGFEEKTWFYKCLLLWDTNLEAQSRSLWLAYSGLANYVCEQVFAFLRDDSNCTFSNISDYRLPVKTRLN